MNPKYAALGMDTAWQRFEVARGGAIAEFGDQVRALEGAAAVLNLAPELVHLATELAALQPELDSAQRLALITLVLVSLAALQEGSTRFPVTGEISKAPMRRMLDALCGSPGKIPGSGERMASIEALLRSRAASAVVGYAKDDYKPLLYLEPYIYHQRIYHAETELTNRLAAMLKSGASARVEAKKLSAALDDVVSRPIIVQNETIAISKEQWEAVAAAAGTGLTVISGGPGTGKTSIIVAIMRLMVRLGIAPNEIALAAPTGKAAYRMGECVRDALRGIGTRDHIDQSLLDAGQDPSTIHRLLKYSPDSGRFRHHRNNPLGAKVVIVDESSMLDLTLMERLTNAIQPGARLILLGDADQLPSVAAGAVFRDFVEHSADGADSQAHASVRLKENYRINQEDAAGRAILTAARSIKDGRVDLFGAAADSEEPILKRRPSAADLEFAGVELLAASSRDLGAFLDRWYEERVRGSDDIADLVSHTYLDCAAGFGPDDCERLRRLFAHLGKSRILSVTRVLESGAERINARLHARVAARAGIAAERANYLVGEPLMVLRNDYERELFNGDQGIRLWVRRGDGPQIPMAVFSRGDNFVAFRFEALRDAIELGYAMTVHKAQGSEFDSIAIVLPENPLPILTRELIYTAVSRSRHSVVFLGDQARLYEAIANRIERFSGLSERLAVAGAL